MKAEDMKTKTADELVKLVLELRREQMNVRFQRAGGANENAAQIRKTRRAIARAKTFLNMKRREEGAKAVAKAPKAKAKKTAA